VLDQETRATREDSILEGLNEAQRGAVLHGEGPLLIVAGAGTGKTTVLTRRIAHLITTKRARPEEILALTFTEKAARERTRKSAGRPAAKQFSRSIRSPKAWKVAMKLSVYP